MADSQLHHSGPVFVQFHSHLLEERRSSTGYPVMAGVTSYQPSSPEAPQAGRRQVDTGPACCGSDAGGSPELRPQRNRLRV